MERLKSLVLTALIISSLIMSGLLWYRPPNVAELSRDDYIPQQLIGETRHIEELVLPRTIVAHDGRGNHFLALPGVSLYDTIVRQMGEWRFTDIEAVSVSLKQWKTLLQQRVSFEFRFPTSIPATLFSERLFPELDAMEEQQWIDRIWVYREHGDIHVLFISDLENKVHIGTVNEDEAEVLPRIFERQLLRVEPIIHRFASAHPYEPPQLSTFYIPAESVSLPAWEASHEVIDIEQMKQLLFLDPSFVRTVSNNDDDVIMQDGSRSVRYTTSDHMLYYQNFKHTIVEKATVSSNMIDAVKFINEHGGWMTDYALVEIDGTINDEQPNRYSFRMLHNGLPVYDRNEGQMRYGTLITVERDGGHVLRYERSLDYSSDHQMLDEQEMIGGQPFLEQIEQVIPLSSVRDVFPAYIAVKKQDTLEFTPGWRIQQLDGTEVWLPSTGDREDIDDGLE